MRSKVLRGFKVTTINRTRTCGVACQTFTDLLIKGCSKLKLDENDVIVYLQDGTIVDSESYFSTIPEQTILIFSTREEKFVTGADVIYNALKLVNVELLKAGEAITQFFDEEIKAKVCALSELLRNSDSNLVFTKTKEEHPDWFIGIESNAKTKEDYLEKRCQDRMRNFLYKSIAEIKSTTEYKVNVNSRKRLDYVIQELKMLLTKHRYCGIYFVRNSENALCNSRGDFKCAGLWNSERCFHHGGKGHEINPYSTREERIIFSTWNLDHRIERCRTIIPAMIRCVEQNGHTRINTKYVFELLFTKKNLGLVHIVCHDKSAHSTANCDLSQMILV